MGWVKHWAGKWSVVSCSYFGQYYTLSIASLLKARMQRTAIISSNGHAACFFPKGELDAFGKTLAAQADANPAVLGIWVKELRAQTDCITSLLKRLRTEEAGKKQIAEFEAALRKYTAPHIAVKKVVDYLPPHLLQEWLPELEAARLYSEKVYTETEEYMTGVVARIAKETGYAVAEVESMTSDELEKYLLTGRMPPAKILRERHRKCALLFKDGKYVVKKGPAAEKTSREVSEPSIQGQIRGTPAYPGRARGVVKVVLDPRKALAFEKGDVLVAAMTRPEYLPLVKRAAAIITDAGGILCHAAIVARELNKPCITGTMNATKMLKDGDFVEVDAAKGFVAIIRKSKGS